MWEADERWLRRGVGRSPLAGYAWSHSFARMPLGVGVVAVWPTRIAVLRSRRVVPDLLLRGVLRSAGMHDCGARLRVPGRIAHGSRLQRAKSRDVGTSSARNGSRRAARSSSMSRRLC